jgi:hypothetical protein
MPGRSPFQIVLSAEERVELGRRVACYTLPHKVVQRAKMILYAAEGLTNVEIAQAGDGAGGRRPLATTLPRRAAARARRSSAVGSPAAFSPRKRSLR